MEASSTEHLVTSAGTLPCSCCKQDLPAELFYEIRRDKGARKDLLGTKRISQCKNCQNQKHVDLDPRKKMLYSARTRANKLGVEFAITIDDIEISTHCPVLGIPFDNLTEEIVVGWVKDKFGDEKVAEIEAALQAQLDEKHAPSKAAGVP